SLQPGQSRTFPAISIDLSRYVSIAQTYIYPMQIDLRSGIDSLTSMFTPVISFIPKPLPALKVQWTIELTWPITYLPDGTFANTSLQDAIAPHGSLAAEVAALHAIETGKSAVPMDLVM